MKEGPVQVYSGVLRRSVLVNERVGWSQTSESVSKLDLYASVQQEEKVKREKEGETLSPGREETESKWND